jgi:hypothetical protein
MTIRDNADHTGAEKPQPPASFYMMATDDGKRYSDEVTAAEALMHFVPGFTQSSRSCWNHTETGTSEQIQRYR